MEMKNSGKETIVMKKDVIVKITGREYGVCEQEQDEQEVKGSFYNKNGKDFILYDVIEGDEMIHTILKIGDEQIEIIKNSIAGRITMVFQKGEWYTTLYHTVAGALEMKFYTKEMTISSSDSSISVYLLYDIFMNETGIGTRQMQIQIQDE